MQGSCHQPMANLQEESGSGPQIMQGPQWKYLQCVLSVPFTLLDIESEAERSSVWISDIYVHGRVGQGDVSQGSSSALLHADGADVWASGVSFVGGPPSANRAL